MERVLVVLADGAQAAFAAGAVAELARQGRRWRVAAGAGLGAQVAALALLGDAEEAERRWLRQAELGCPLLRSWIGAVAERVPAGEGAVILPDVLTTGGWLDPQQLIEHLEPEMGGLPRRLAAAGACLWVAIHDLTAGRSRWVDLATADASSAGTLLRAAASFAGGWPPVAATGESGATRLWGGVVAAPLGEPPLPAAGGVDAVCGFPLPEVARSIGVGGLIELIQRRDEAAAASRVAAFAAGRPGVVTIAPSAAAWAAYAERDGADLGVEWPLPWERNGELARHLVEFGNRCVRDLTSA